MQTVISYYAVTDRIRPRIEAECPGECRFVPVGPLRNLGPRRALGEIRKLKSDRLLIVIEQDTARPLAGPLLILAAMTGSREIRVLWPDGSCETVSRWRIARLAARVGMDQVASRLARRRAARAIARMDSESTPSIHRVDAAGEAVLYLDANLSFGFQAGGGIGHVRGVMDAFVGRGYDVDYVSVKPIPSDRPGTQWLQVPGPGLYSFPPELNYYSFARRYERLVGQWATERRYAFLYQRMSLHNFSGARLRDALRLPLVLEYNGSEAWVAANWSQKLALHDMAVATERTALRHADLVVTVSKVLGEEVAKAGVPRERIVVYPNCIDPQIFDPGRFSKDDSLALRRRLAIPPDALVATFVGTFGTWHGVDFLARAVRRLVEEDRAFVESRKLHFLFVGDGLKMPEVREAVGAAPYSQFVTLAGLVPQKDAPSYLAASDIFLSPHMPNTDGSALFGSPTKLFEYMAMERPIVAADLDQIGAVLKGEYLDDAPAPDGPLAELFTPGDEAGFLQALRAVVVDRDRARQMASRARAAALSTYTWDDHVGAILDRMRDLGILKDQDGTTEQLARAAS